MTLPQPPEGTGQKCRFSRKKWKSEWTKRSLPCLCKDDVQISALQKFCKKAAYLSGRELKLKLSPSAFGKKAAFVFRVFNFFSVFYEMASSSPLQKKSTTLQKILRLFATLTFSNDLRSIEILYLSTILFSRLTFTIHSARSH